MILLSPAKRMNEKMGNRTPSECKSVPQFIDRAEELVGYMRQLNVSELMKLLHVNQKIALLNQSRFVVWIPDTTIENSKFAIDLYNGEVFRSLEISSLRNTDYDFLQNNIRIFSGLYGVLRPFDLILPYRLEISSKLKTVHGNTLYDFWREKITQNILQELKKSEEKIIFNLMSKEYFKALNQKILTDYPIIDFDFLQYNPATDEYRQVVIQTKKARGYMVRYIVENKINSVEGLKGFAMEGYWFHSELSSENRLVFVR